MKNLLTYLILLIVVAGCSSNSLKKEIIGEWKYSDTNNEIGITHVKSDYITISFNDDSYKCRTDDRTLNGSWSIKDSTLTIIEGEENSDMTWTTTFDIIKLTSDSLILNHNFETYYYTRK